MGDDGNRAARSAAWGVVTVVFGGVAAAAWLATPGAPLVVLIAASVCSALAAVGLYMCFASLSGTWPAGRSLRRAPQTDALPAAVGTVPTPPLRLSVAPEIDGLLIRLVVTNNGVRGLFTARVITIIGPDRRLVPGRQSWPIPWLENGSIAPADLPQFDGRSLDFAQFNTGESDPWPHLPYWRFSSLPEPVGVMYHPVGSREEVEAQRFTVIVRIIRAEPSPGHMQRQFAVGVDAGRLVCDPVEPFPLRFTPGNAAGGGLEVVISGQAVKQFPGIAAVMAIRYRIRNYDPVTHELASIVATGAPLYRPGEAPEDDPEYQKVQRAYLRLKRRYGWRKQPGRVGAGKTVRGVLVEKFAWNQAHRLPAYVLMVYDGQTVYAAGPNGLDENGMPL